MFQNQNKNNMLFIVFERYAQCTTTYRMYPGGISCIGIYEADSKPELIQKILSEFNVPYDIIDKEDGSWQECSSERIVWQPGDNSADFGDFDLLCTEVDDIETGSHLHISAIKSHLMDESGEVLIF